MLREGWPAQRTHTLGHFRYFTEAQCYRIVTHFFQLELREP